MLLPYTKLFYKRKRGLKLVFLPHFLHDFWRKLFSTLSFINSPNSIASLSLLLEILDNTCLGNNCCLFCDVRNFEINYSFLIKSFFYIKHNLAKKEHIKKSIHHDKNPIFTMKNKKKLPKKFLKIHNSIFYFILNSPSPTVNITCSNLYLDGKNMRKEC